MADYGGVQTCIKRSGAHLAHQPAQRRAVMRKFVISLAAAGAALVVASPAAAQYYPQQQPYGYSGYAGYNGAGYGLNNGYGQMRALQQRIDAVQYRIDRLDRRHGARGRSVENLRAESRNIERQLRQS